MLAHSINTAVSYTHLKTNYTAGQVAISTLLEAVPEVNKIANVTGEQIVKIGSQDMNCLLYTSFKENESWKTH